MKNRTVRHGKGLTMNNTEITPEPLKKEIIIKHNERFKSKIVQDEICLLCCKAIGRREYEILGETVICGDCYYDSGGNG